MKKEYFNPEKEVVKISANNCILYGSNPEDNTSVDPSEEIEPGNIGARDGDFFDDDF